MTRASLIDTLSLLGCLKHSISALTMSLRSGSRNIFTLNPFCSFALVVLGVFPNLLDRRIYETKFPTNISFVFSIFYFSVILTLSSTLKIFLMLESVAVLCIYQSPVNHQRQKSRQQHYTQGKLFYYLLLSFPTSQNYNPIISFLQEGGMV
jgi:hypothetical protein